MASYLLGRERGHHPKVDVGELSLLGQKQVPRVWVGVKKANVQDLARWGGAEGVSALGLTFI